MKNRIKELRESRDMSLGDLAEGVGTTNQQVSHLELGKRRLTADWMVRIARVLGCVPWALVEEVTLPDMDPQTQRLLDLFSRMSAVERDAIMVLLSSIAARMPGIAPKQSV